MEGAELRAMKVTPGSLLSSASVDRIRLRALARGVLRNRGQAGENQEALTLG